MIPALKRVSEQLREEDPKARKRTPPPSPQLVHKVRSIIDRKYSKYSLQKRESEKRTSRIKIRFSLMLVTAVRIVVRVPLFRLALWQEEYEN